MVSSLYLRDAAGEQTESRLGSYVYSARLRVASETGDAVSKVCDGLRGNAFVAAHEVGFDSLCEIVNGTSRGIDTHIRHMREMVFPLTEHEPKELFMSRELGPLGMTENSKLRTGGNRRAPHLNNTSTAPHRHLSLRNSGQVTPFANDVAQGRCRAIRADSLCSPAAMKPELWRRRKRARTPNGGARTAGREPG